MIWTALRNWQKQPSDGIVPHATARNLRQFEHSEEVSSMPELVNGFEASIKELKAAKVGPAGIDIAYHRLGEPDAPAVADDVMRRSRRA